MAKYELKFLDRFEDGSFIKCENVSMSEFNHTNEDGNYEDIILIKANSFEGNANIGLDKSTAIKFAKALRTEINKMEG